MEELRNKKSENHVYHNDSKSLMGCETFLGGCYLAIRTGNKE